MLKILVVSHGPLADALMVSARMVYGELPHTSCLCLTEGGGIEAFKADFARELQRIEGEADGVLVLCDLLSGTPYNIACSHAFDPQRAVPMAVVTGVNFAMLLCSAELLAETDVEHAAQTLMAEAHNAIVSARRHDPIHAEEF